MKIQKQFLPLSGLLLLTLCLTLPLSGNQAQAKSEGHYSAKKAVAYADSCFRKKGKSYKVHYSKKYGKDLCAGYVSQCLKEGGLTMDGTWYWKSKKKSSLTWRVSRMLFSYLKKNGHKIIHSPSASQVKPGDIIFYWTNGGWGHCSICVGKTADGTPRINAFNDAHYHFSYWTLGYKTCVVSMESKTETPSLKQTAVSGGKKISLSCPTEGAVIYYTLNGKTPTKHSARYREPFILTKNARLRAVAMYSQYKKSDVLSKYIDTKKIIDNGIYFIHTTSSQNKVLGIPGSNLQENTALQLMNSNAEYNRKFSVTYKGNGLYTFSLLHSGLAMTEEPLSPGDSRQASPAENGTPSQKKASVNSLGRWRISYVRSGGMRIVSAATGRYLSVAKNLRTGSTAYTQKKAEASGQLWNFKKTSRSQLSLEHLAAPVNLKKKSSFVFSGNVTSNYTIQEVTAAICTKQGRVLYSASAFPKKKSYSLRKLSGKIKFGKLGTGSYRFRVTATDATQQKKTLYNKTFRVKKK